MQFFAQFWWVGPAMLALLAIWLLSSRIFRGRRTAANPASRTATLVTLVIGLAVSIVGGWYAGHSLAVDLANLMPTASFPAMRWAGPGAIIVVSVLVGFIIFLSGVFHLPVAWRGYGSIVGQPISVIFGTGYGWWFFKNILPFLTSFKSQVGKEDHVDIENAIYATADGLDISMNASALRIVNNPLLAERIETGTSGDDETNINMYVQSKLRSSIQAFLLERQTEFVQIVQQVQDTQRQRLDAAHVQDLLRRVAVFKGGVMTEGAIRIAELMNHGGDGIHYTDDGTIDRGIYIPEVQIENVRLPQNVEDKIHDLYEELIESISLAQDAATKKRQAEILMSLYAEQGVDLDRMNASERAQLVSEAYNRALAREGQAQIKQISFTGAGRPPPGVLVSDQDDHGQHGHGGNHH